MERYRGLTSTKPPEPRPSGPEGGIDDRSVDMDESREQPPAPEASPPEIPQPAGQPSPVQQAQRAYGKHCTACTRCRDVDRNRCDDGQQLYRAWIGACDDAYRQIAGETAR
jgi:hypothetical protein